MWNWICQVAKTILTRFEGAHWAHGKAFQWIFTWFSVLPRICGGFQPSQNGLGSGAGLPSYGFNSGIHRSLETDSSDNDTIDLQDNSVRKRRSAYQSGAGGCSKIPQQNCKKIPHKQPRRQCSTVDKPSCNSTPRQVHKQECKDVPRQQCQQQQSSCGAGQTTQKCHKVERKIPRLVAHKVPQKHCERLNPGSNQGIRLVGVFNSPAVGPAPSAGGLSTYNSLGASSPILHPSGYFWFICWFYRVSQKTLIFGVFFWDTL